MAEDGEGAFLPGPRLAVAGSVRGPLSGLSFLAKDLFDVAGHPTGGGNPDWERTHPVPDRHAWAVQALLDAGASLVGKTVTCEVSMGILGFNPHCGTPPDPAAPGRMPGGSSSGSASAVPAGACDVALGTDPAARCGFPRPCAGCTACARPTAEFPSMACAGRPRAPTPPAGSRATPPPSPAWRRCCWASRSPVRRRAGSWSPPTLSPWPTWGWRTRSRRRWRRWARCSAVRRNLWPSPGALEVWAGQRHVLQRAEACRTFEA